jgi:glutathione-regulated potassium-efflux system ancillary protein KefG
MNAIKKTLVLFAHPRFENSRIHQALLKKIKNLTGLRIHDLYEHYPEFNIDVEYEKNLLLEHDIIVWMHPFYWYSAPPILKQWIDLVLQHGWAYGKGGTALTGKRVLSCISSGGPREAYQSEGFHTYSVHEFLRPFERTATLCNMEYLPPFFVHGSHKISDEELEKNGILYQQLLIQLTHSSVDSSELKKHFYLNDWIKTL